MEVHEFTVSEPDSDGDMNTSFEVSGENTSEHEIRLIRMTTNFLNEKGHLFSESTTDEEVRLEPGEEFTMSAGLAWLKAVFCDNPPGLISGRANATFFRREMARLGEVKIPSAADQCETREVEIESSCLDPKVCVLVTRKDDSDDGTVNILFRCGVTNVTSDHIEHMVLKAELIDEDDAVLESNESTLSASPGVSRTFDSQIWGVRKSMLKKARMKFSLFAYIVVNRETCEASVVPA